MIGINSETNSFISNILFEKCYNRKFKKKEISKKTDPSSTYTSKIHTRFFDFSGGLAKLFLFQAEFRGFSEVFSVVRYIFYSLFSDAMVGQMLTFNIGIKLFVLSSSPLLFLIGKYHKTLSRIGHLLNHLARNS